MQPKLHSTPISINSMPQTSVVSLGVRAGASGKYTITATELNDLRYVTLEDTRTNTFTEIANKSYTFSYTEGKNQNRILLHFSMLSVPDASSSKIKIYSYHNTVYFNLGDKLKSDIFICNTAGQRIAGRQSASGMVEIKLANTGVYLVKVVNKENTVVRKVFVQ